MNGSNSIGKQGTSNSAIKICLVTLPIADYDNNTTTVCKAVNVLMKVIHGIEGDANRVKIDLWKSKQPNLEVLKYIIGGEYPKEEVGKYTYAVRHRWELHGNYPIFTLVMVIYHCVERIW